MSLWVDIMLGVSASLASAVVIGGASSKLVTYGLRRAISGELEKKLAPVSESVNARFDKNDLATDDAVQKITEVRAEQERIKLDLATQFGGNGGGIRQAINDLNKSLSSVEGAFEQHLRETESRGGHSVE